MKRHKMQALVKWKNRKNHKPLILWGARQCGKTWLMREFGKNEYENTAYVSFYNNRRMSEIFEKDYDPHRIIRDLEIHLHKKIDPDNTLLIFDEVQSAPKVVESLKYFCEDAGEYDVIAAGSLLGVALHKGISFPVGKVDEIHLYPLSFSEFLEACEEEGLLDLLREPESANYYSEKYEELLREYYIVGGMPEAVLSYINEKDYDRVREIQLNIISQYEGDFGKHIKETELPRTRMVWNSIPVQLSKENRKFFFGQIKKGARSKEFEVSIQWLEDAGLVYKVHKVTKPGMPLKSYIDISSFKLFFIDIGLLGALSELDIYSVLRGSNVFEEFKGAMTEQYVLQELICGEKYTPYYYSASNGAYETDFLIQKDGEAVPIEVKSSVSIKSKALKYYCEKFSPSVAIRVSMMRYQKQNSITNIPLWMFGTAL